jgi:hypothetical protein
MCHVRICAGGRPQGRSLPRPEPCPENAGNLAGCEVPVPILSQALRESSAPFAERKATIGVCRRTSSGRRVDLIYRGVYRTAQANSFPSR